VSTYRDRDALDICYIRSTLALGPLSCLLATDNLPGAQTYPVNEDQTWPLSSPLDFSILMLRASEKVFKASREQGRGGNEVNRNGRLGVRMFLASLSNLTLYFHPLSSSSLCYEILCTCYTDLNSIWVAPALLSILFQWARRVLSIRPDVVSTKKKPPWMIAVCAWTKSGKSQAVGCSMVMSREQGALGEYLSKQL
jgi:hypothetical protein